MIDSLNARYRIRREKPLDPDYQPRNAIQSKKLINPHADKLAVIFPGWHTHNFPVSYLAKRLSRKGWAVLYYDFHDQILEPDEDVVVESFKYIRRTISDHLEELTAHGQYSQIHLIGMSLGTVPWAMVADTYTKFTSATVAVGGDGLAVDMWHGLRTQHYRHMLEKMHVGVRRLDEEWHGIAPVNHLKHFGGKKVKAIISLSDEFILTKYQKRLAQRLEEAGAIVKVKRRFVGHTLTILRFCLFDNPI